MKTKKFYLLLEYAYRMNLRMYFNSQAPRGARQKTYVMADGVIYISIHKLLAELDQMEMDVWDEL